jgi:hypothetical protein
MAFVLSIPAADVWQDDAWEARQRRLLTAQFGPNEVPGRTPRASTKCAVVAVACGGGGGWGTRTASHRKLAAIRRPGKDLSKAGSFMASVNLVARGSTGGGAGAQRKQPAVRRPESAEAGEPLRWIKLHQAGEIRVSSCPASRQAA